MIACPDPFHQVAGRGERMLREAGVAVRTGVRRAEAEALNAGFFTRLKTGAPLIAADARASLFDMDFRPEPGEGEGDALKRLGGLGVTRVRRV